MRTWLFVFFVGFAINAQSATHQSIHVDDNARPGGDGSAAKPYNTIADAVARARAMGGDPTINVAPGRYELASTIFIDVPLAARGETQLERWPREAIQNPRISADGAGVAIRALFVETEATGFEFLCNLLLAAGCRSQSGKKVRLLF